MPSMIEPLVDTDYLGYLLHPEKFNETVRVCASVLKLHDFDTIAFRGMSGAMIAPALAAKLNKHMILVRKTGDGSHSFCSVEGNRNAQRYVIVDDFISTGATVKAIYDAVEKFCPTQPVCIGVLETQRLFSEYPHGDKLKAVPGRKTEATFIT